MVPQWPMLEESGTGCQGIVCVYHSENTNTYLPTIIQHTCICKYMDCMHKSNIHVVCIFFNQSCKSYKYLLSEDYPNQTFLEDSKRIRKHT